MCKRVKWNHLTNSQFCQLINFNLLTLKSVCVCVLGEQVPARPGEGVTVTPAGGGPVSAG